ncbi:hypothetical protein [Actinomadura nitritigenes]|uniref:hypothetical protein n=1 Tax=Actinomadura nitritigenes TaxID=134602 RepID=UPI003D94312E
MPIDDDSMKKIRLRQDAYNRRIALIRGDVTLSHEGKRQAMAVARHQALNDIEAIKQAAEQTYSGRRAELERKLFNLSADYPDSVGASLSMRDAADRVREIKTGAEAQTLMAQAIRHGDHIMQRALFDAGWERAGDRMTNSGWGEVVRAYVDQARPDLKPVVDELVHLQNVDSRERRTMEAIETGVHRPPEMQGMSPADVQRITAAAPPDGANVSHLNPGGGTQTQQTPSQAFAEMTRDAQNGAYGA